jgi:sigma-B regulation protein RsbU (phosphoserine phosphatase)
MAHSWQSPDPDWRQFLILGEQIAHQTVPEAQCQTIAQLAGQILSAEVRVWLVHPAYPLWRNYETEIMPHALATPLAHKAFDERQTTCACRDPESQDEVISSSFNEMNPTSLAVPLLTKGTLLGIMQADRPKGQPFSQPDIRLAEGLAMQAAIAMESTRQEGLKNWHFEQLNLVRSVSAKIASLSRPEDLYQQVTQLILKTFEYDYVAIFTLDERKHVFRFQGSAGHEQTPPLHAGFSVSPGEGIIGIVGANGSEIVSPDVRKDIRYRYIDVIPQTRSEAALPIKVENRILGVLDFQSNQVNSFQEGDMLVLRALADNIALAIESKHLTDGLERRAEHISSVFEVSHALNSILDLDQLLSAVVKLIQNRFGYPFIHIYTVHPGRRLVIYQTGIGERSEVPAIQSLNYPMDAQHGIIPWVARYGKTFLSNDVTQEPLYLPPDPLPHDTHSELTVPLSHGDEVLGILDIQSRETNAFDENDCSLFESLAASIAVSMHNARLYRSEQWRRKVAESFRDVAQLISANLPLDQLLDVILEKLDNNLPCDASAIWLIDEGLNPTHQPNNHRLRLAATRNIDPERIFSALQEGTVHELLERALDSQLPLIRRPDSPIGPLGAALGFLANHSSIVAPMLTNNQPLGVITLAHHQDGRYGSEAQAITSTFASYAAVAIQNARLYNETQEQALISTMLLQVAEASQTIMTIEDLLTTMVRMTRLLVGVVKCAFLIWDDSLQSFQLMSWYGFDPEGENQRVFAPDLPGLAKLATKRSTFYLSDPEVDFDLPEFSLAQGTIVALPLLVRGNVIGGFLVGLQMAGANRIETCFDPKALAILQGIAHQTGMTIDNLRLLEARQEEAYVTTALLQVAQTVVSSTDLNDTLDTIVHLLPILVGIDACIIYLWDALNHLFRPTQVYAENRREEDAILSRPFAPGEYLLLDTIHQKGEVYLCQIPDPGLPFHDWANLPCNLYDQRKVQSNLPQGDWVLGYPLSLQGHIFGILVVRESNASPAFWERKMEILNGIAQQTSLAIQNDLFKQELVQTERIEREIQLARQIQETFLPDSLPQINHWELDLRWETAREVGGDFYDIIKLGEKRVGLVIADVSDKGIPAALYMTVARTLIRANAAGSLSPAKVLEEVNKLLLNDSSDAMFITVVYAILELETGEMLYANAGHNRPLLYRRKKGVLEQLPKGGMALGVMDEYKLQDHKIIIHPGDSLILYTDGVTDAMSPEGNFFGEERLRKLLMAYGKEPVHEMLEYLDDALIEFRRGLAPMDDITLLAVQREQVHRKSPGRPKKNFSTRSENYTGEEA